ncbi:hypothetical protein KA005_70085, partial [bacterium]|nr:hypothetical protein [bacterium]
FHIDQRFSRNISGKAGLPDITLDSLIISATPYDELRELYGDGNRDKQRFVYAHILFFQRSEDYHYINIVFNDE